MREAGHPKSRLACSRAKYHWIRQGLSNRLVPSGMRADSSSHPIDAMTSAATIADRDAQRDRLVAAGRTAAESTRAAIARETSQSACPSRLPSEQREIGASTPLHEEELSALPAIPG
jgi:hypothetical protein